MSKKNIVFIVGIFLLLMAHPATGFAEGVDERLTRADQAFEQQQYTDALSGYEAIYGEGYFNEKMLYRLAFMHENLKNYPAAIYYLKKAAQEFGNESSEAKIKQMMQMNGGTRLFSADGWDAYLLFYNRYGTLLWIGFAIVGLGMAATLFVPKRSPNSLRSVGLISGWTLFAVVGIFLLHHLVRSPHRAVLVEKTSFYDFPSYAANSFSNVFSLGETVAVTDEEDIWSLVEAGGREFWVPRRVLRDL
ncbi:MAG: tetratricopeptide repeat protein [Bacteroidota bacterium]